MRQPRVLQLLLVMVVIAALAPFATSTGAGAATVTGGDKGGADITVADGDVLSGAFTNVGTFTIPAGVTAHVEEGTALSIEATTIIIAGVLDGTGAGELGGASSAAEEDPGNPGEGPGGGAGGNFGDCVHSTGGGGGGYGGAGGASSKDEIEDPPAALGGPTYGTPSGSDIAAGSGGGAGGNICTGFGNFHGAPGGNGGASISLVGEITLTGSIIADGADGDDGVVNFEFGTPGGGGGSGGGVLLSGTLHLSGTISAAGGNGGDGTPGPFAQAGGGGGGGRIKLFGEAETLPGFAMVVTGGSAGVGTGAGTPAQNGDPGTTAAVAVDIPPAAPPPVVLIPSFTG